MSLPINHGRFYAMKPQKVGDREVTPGEEVPEAANWKNIEVWIRAGYIQWIPNTYPAGMPIPASHSSPSEFSPSSTVIIQEPAKDVGMTPSVAKEWDDFTRTGTNNPGFVDFEALAREARDTHHVNQEEAVGKAVLDAVEHVVEQNIPGQETNNVAKAAIESASKEERALAEGPNITDTIESSEIESDTKGVRRGRSIVAEAARNIRL